MDFTKYQYLKKEIEDLESRIIEFGTGVKSMQINEVSVSSSHKNISIQEKRMELISLWIEKRVSAIEECLKIERYIKEVSDPIIRQIMRYKFIDCKTWNNIDTLMGYAEGTSKKTYYRYKKLYPFVP